MSAISFIFENTIFKKYYPNFKNIIRSQFSFSKDTITKSNKYLVKLGFPQKEIKINLENIIFSKQEKDLLTALIKNKGKILDFDQVANIIWKDKADDKFSLEAMAKLVENLRRKIKTLGINKEVIFTKRGKGYIFN